MSAVSQLMYNYIKMLSTRQIHNERWTSNEQLKLAHKLSIRFVEQMSVHCHRRRKRERERERENGCAKRLQCNTFRARTNYELTFYYFRFFFRCFVSFSQPLNILIARIVNWVKRQLIFLRYAYILITSEFVWQRQNKQKWIRLKDRWKKNWAKEATKRHNRFE